MSTRPRKYVRSAAAGPTTEIGQVNLAGALPWASFGWVDQLEHVPELVWPASVQTYNQMRTDSQCNGLYMGITLPIRRYRWAIKPNGARDEIVQGLSEDLNLPVQGDEEKPSGRVRDRFSWDEWLRQALLSLVYGFYYFEHVGEIRGGRWHLKNLAARPPGTISEVNITQTGDLQSIKQAVGVSAPEIPANRLVPLAWDREGGNWFGRSLFRHMYKNWVIKDRLIRVDAMKHERNGLGVPNIEAPPGASKAVIDRLDAIAQAFRAGDNAGIATPNGARLRLVGVEGSVPDTLASINYHDEAMARALLMMFMQLGQTRTGSRALGETFADYFALAQETIAFWIEDQVAMYVIEDWVNWNYGEDEAIPRVVHERNPEPDLAVADLVALVEKGIINVDPDLEEFIRGRYMLPEANPEEPEEPPMTVLPPGTPPQQLPAPQLPAPASPATATPVEARRKRTTAAAVGLSSLLPLPSRVLRRQPYEQEVHASVDYAQMEQDYQTARTALVADVSREQAQQIQEIREAIIAAKGDLKKLASMSVTPIHSDTILARLIQMAQTGIYQAINEAKRQGVTIAMPNVDKIIKSLEARATAVDSLLARSISEAAGRKAIMMTGPKVMTPTDVASTVTEYLESLSDKYLMDQLGGALQQAMNAGRKAVMDDGPTAQYYASELLDEATCEPCTDIDGTEYPDLDAAEADYPTGGYMDCLGGPRCRGTLIAVYESEEPNTGEAIE